jgi:hypothetical protein
MGPATAKRETGDLFEGEIYEQVQKTPVEVVYQIFQVSDNIRIALLSINSAKYSKYRKTHMSLALFSLLVRAFQEVNVKWGAPDFTTLLNDHADDWGGKRFSAWNKLTKCAFDYIYDEYQLELKRAKKRDDDVPTIINYFKNQKSIAKLLKKPLSAELKRLARKVLES